MGERNAVCFQSKIFRQATIFTNSPVLVLHLGNDTGTEENERRRLLSSVPPKRQQQQQGKEDLTVEARLGKDYQVDIPPLSLRAGTRIRYLGTNQEAFIEKEDCIFDNMFYVRDPDGNVRRE